MAKLLVICGPTATGKTALALKLAKKFDGELVNADSRQVYRGMDIGTGKDLRANSKLKTQNSKLEIGKEYQVGYYLVCRVPIWLLDIVWPDYRFNVADYVKLAIPVIKNIWARGKLPILVGGTGFYIKALLEGVETINISPDWRLRKNLEKLTVFKLQEQLKTINPDRFNRMNYSDQYNPRRLIRAIEVTKKKKLKNRQLLSLGLGSGSVLKIGLLAPREKLDQAIAERVQERLNLGLLTEIESLLTRFTFSGSVLGETIAYKEWQNYFPLSEEEKKDQVIEIIDKWKTDERQYARRQMTWFGRDPLINWFRSDDEDLFLKVAKKVEQWYIKDDDDKKG